MIAFYMCACSMAGDVDAGGRPQKRYYNREMGHRNNHARKEKKTKFSSYIRKLRWDQLQSHIWGRASQYMSKWSKSKQSFRKNFINIFCWFKMFAFKVGKHTIFCIKSSREQISYCMFRCDKLIFYLVHYIVQDFTHLINLANFLNKKYSGYSSFKL